MISTDSLYLKTYKTMFHLRSYMFGTKDYDPKLICQVSVMAILDLLRLTVEITVGQTP